MSITNLKPLQARLILQPLEESGQPPPFGVTLFSVGLEPYLKAFQDEYLGERGTLRAGSSSFKLVEAYYGGGKTHFLYTLQEKAWQNNFVTAYVELTQKNCPFDKLEFVYKEIANRIQYPPSRDASHEEGERGLEAFLRFWAKQVQSGVERWTAERTEDYLKTIKNIESTSFSNAVKAAFRTLITRDEPRFADVLLWLKGEGYDAKRHKPWGILEKIDKSTALRMIRSLAQWVRAIGYSGLVFFFDEGERNISLATKRERREAANNLVKLINETSYQRWPGTLFIYTVPDWQQFSKIFGEGGEYQALEQRLERIFTETNPLAPHINLERLTVTEEDKQHFLSELGQKLYGIFEVAYNPMPRDRVDEAIKQTTAVCITKKGDISYRRLFVKTFIAVLLALRANPDYLPTREFVESVYADSAEALKQREAQVSDEY